MNKQQLIAIAKRTVAMRRQKALDECDQRLRALRSHDDWRICEQNLKNAEIAVALYKKQDQTQNVEKYGKLRAQLLKKYGMTEEDLSPKFCCKFCEDTGFVGAKTCVCLQTELRKLIVNQSNVANPNCTFGNSTETLPHNKAVYKKAEEICKTAQLQNVLLLGQNGTGKTFLLSACANLCADLGKSVLFLTAYNLNSLFLECHLSDFSTNKTILDNLLDTDALVIDDLGTEITYRSVTAEYLFALINERIARGKQTFVSTNLSLQDIREKYDERIFSRLVDQKITFVAKLEGNDKRISSSR